MPLRVCSSEARHSLVVCQLSSTYSKLFTVDVGNHFLPATKEAVLALTNLIRSFRENREIAAATARLLKFGAVVLGLRASYLAAALGLKFFAKRLSGIPVTLAAFNVKVAKGLSLLGKFAKGLLAVAVAFKAQAMIASRVRIGRYFDIISKRGIKAVIGMAKGIKLMNVASIAAAASFKLLAGATGIGLLIAAANTLSPLWRALWNDAFEVVVVSVEAMIDVFKGFGKVLSAVFTKPWDVKGIQEGWKEVKEAMFLGWESIKEIGNRTELEQEAIETATRKEQLIKQIINQEREIREILGRRLTEDEERRLRTRYQKLEEQELRAMKKLSQARLAQLRQNQTEIEKFEALNNADREKMLQTIYQHRALLATRLGRRFNAEDLMRLKERYKNATKQEIFEEHLKAKKVMDTIKQLRENMALNPLRQTGLIEEIVEDVEKEVNRSPQSIMIPVDVTGAINKQADAMKKIEVPSFKKFKDGVKEVFDDFMDFIKKKQAEQKAKGRSLPKAKPGTTVGEGTPFHQGLFENYKKAMANATDEGVSDGFDRLDHMSLFQDYKREMAKNTKDGTTEGFDKLDHMALFAAYKKEMEKSTEGAAKDGIHKALDHAALFEAYKEEMAKATGDGISEGVETLDHMALLENYKKAMADATGEAATPASAIASPMIEITGEAPEMGGIDPQREYRTREEALAAYHERVRDMKENFHEMSLQDQYRYMEETINLILSLGDKLNAADQAVMLKNVLTISKIKKDANTKDKKTQYSHWLDLFLQKKGVDDAGIKATRDTLNNYQQLQTSNNETMQTIGKAAAITQIGVDTATAVMSAYRAGMALFGWLGPGASHAAAVAMAIPVGIFGAEQIARVKNPKGNPVGGAQQGGLVGRLPGTPATGDHQPFLLEPGELVLPKQDVMLVREAAQKTVDEDASFFEEDAEQKGFSLILGFEENAASVIAAKNIEDREIGIGVFRGADATTG